MQPASPTIPDNEASRLAAIRDHAILDTPPDGTFDRITRMASALFQVPISIVSIVDHDRIWFKSRHGLEVEQIGRDPGLCASAILEDEIWLIENARTDPRALANPLVAGEFGLQFYAGAPLTMKGGFNFGTLCIIDHEPRTLTPAEREVLNDLAAIVVDEMELRYAARQVAADAQFRVELAERRSHQVTQLNDDVVQCLAVAKLALELDEPSKALPSIDRALIASKQLLSSMLDESQPLRRTRPSV
ncbi:MAG: GAF domain-containing protein [Thermoleophilia bacterium]|nr:GAF domain-containing protein [Thermoleophilia bacterium]